MIDLHGMTAYRFELCDVGIRVEGITSAASIPDAVALAERLASA